jgi:hypothetical protein
MTKHTRLASGLAVFLLVVSCAPSLQKGTITITTHIDFSAEPYHGTFEVTEGPEVLGCVSGSFVDTPTASAVLKKLTCESGTRSGTFTVEFNPQNIPGPGDENGPWTIKEGTADFAELSGGGDFSVINDDAAQSGVETLTGEIQFNN